MANEQTLTLKVQVTESGAVRVLNQVADGVDKVGDKSGKSASLLTKLGISTVTLNQGLQLLQNTVGKAATALGGLVRQGAALETTYARAATEIAGNASNAIASLKAEVLELSKVIPKSVEDLGGAAVEAVARGYENLDDAMSVTTAGAKLATATFGSAKDVTRDLALNMTRFGVEASEAGRVANAFFVLARDGAGDVADLGNRFGAAAETMKRLGVDIFESISVVSALTQEGLSSAQAMRGLQGAMLSLLKPTKEMEAVIKAAGFASGEAMVKQLGLGGALKLVNDIAAKQPGLLEDSIQGISSQAAVTKLATDAWDDFQRAQAETRNGTAALDEGLGKVSDTLESQEQLLRNAGTRLREAGFEKIGPVLTEMAKAAIEAFDDTEQGAIDLAAVMADTVVPTARLAATTVFQLANAGLFLVDVIKEFRRELPEGVDASDGFEQRAEDFDTLMGKIQAGASAGAVKAEAAAAANQRFAQSLAEIGIDGEATNDELARLVNQYADLEKAQIPVTAANIAGAKSWGVIAEGVSKVKAAAGDAEGDVTEFNVELAKTGEKAKTAAELMKEALGAIEEKMKPGVDTAKALADLETMRFERMADTAKAQGDQITNGGALLQQALAADDAARSVAEAEAAVLQAKIEQLTATEALALANMEQVKALVAQKGALEAVAGTYDANAKKAQETVTQAKANVKEVETVGKRMAATIGRLVEDTFSGIVQGTRKLKDIVGGVRDALVAGMARTFSEVIQQKVEKLDTPLEQNVGGIGGLFKTLGMRVLSSFAGIFKGIVSGFQGLGKLFKGAKGLAGLFGSSGAAAGAGSSVPAGLIAAPQVGTGSLAISAASGTGAAGFAATAGYAGAAAAIGVILTVVAHMLEKAFSPKLADEVKKDVRDGLNAILVKQLKIITDADLREAGRPGGKVVSKTVPTLGDRLDEGQPVGDRARVLALLASLGDSPFSNGTSDNRRMFSIFGGQIQSILEDFPEKEGEISKAIVQSFSEGLGDAINKMQEQFVRIVDETRGTALGDGPPPQLKPPGAGAEPDRTKPEESQKSALQRLIDEGFLLPLEDAVMELVDIFAADLPLAVQKSVPKLVNDAFGLAQKAQLKKLTDQIFEDLKAGGATGTDEAVRRRAERLAQEQQAESITTVDGQQIQRGLEIEVEAFGKLSESILAASQEIIAGKGTADAIKRLNAGLSASVAERAGQVMNEVLLKVADFDNLLGPVFRNLEVRATSIAERFQSGEISSAQAVTEIDEMTEMLGTDFEALAQKAEAMGPLIEKFAELQENMQLALTSLGQAADRASGLGESLDLMIADLTGDGVQARLDAKVKDAIEQQQAALDKAGETLGPAFAALFNVVGKRAGAEPGFTLDDVGLDAVRQNIRDLSDQDLKRLVGQFEELANATAARAAAEIAALENQLALVEEWASLTDGVRAALDEIELAGLDSFDRGPKEFAQAQQRFAEALDDFQTGTDAEKLVGAQDLVSAGPALLAAAEAAGIGPGSARFELLRDEIAKALKDVEKAAAAKEAERDTIQQQIRDVQTAAAEQLRLLKEYTTTTQEELLRRSAEASEELTDAEGPLGDLKPTREAMEKVVARLDKGINVFQVGSDKIQKGAFESIGLARGGVVTAREQPALLHGPEAVIPLDKLPGLMAGMIAPELDRVRTRGGGGTGDMLGRLERLLGRTGGAGGGNVIAKIAPVLEYHEAEIREHDDEGREDRRGRRGSREMDRQKAIRRELMAVLRDAETRREIRRLLSGME
jgi:TP901 family phage tail tape measure protein